MGRATEQLAERMGEGVGGLLNATFGNAAELIIALAALRAGLHDVVKASIAGSIVGNILLVLGAAMLAGGLRHPEQHFNRAGRALAGDDADARGDRADPARRLSSRGWAATRRSGLGALSVSISIVLLVVYVLFLVSRWSPIPRCSRARTRRRKAKARTAMAGEPGRARARRRHGCRSPG